MGLDQFAYAVDERPASNVDFEEADETHEIFYWRKHPDLQGWMKMLYRQKGGKDEHFNCVPVLLTLEDLQQLEDDLRFANLPKTTGFFFGESRTEDIARTMEFIVKARKMINEGKYVYYSSWW